MPVSILAVVFAAYAIALISVVICIAYVYCKKRVMKLEIELKEVQMVQPNDPYGQATQLQPNGGASY